MTKCEFCERLARRLYTRSGRGIQLCEACFDRQQVQDAYEDQLPLMSRLTEAGDYEGALRVLQDIFDAQSSHDHDGWLAGTVLAHQALIFTEQGRNEEALDALRSRAQRGFADSSEFLVNQLAMARALDRLGRRVEAIRELEQGLDAAQESSIPTALSLFVLLASISGRERQAVTVRYRELLTKVIQYFGLQVSAALLNDPISLSRPIMAAGSANEEAQARYEALLTSLGEMKKNSAGAQAIADVINAYVNKEPVGFYRQMAQRLIPQT